MIGGSLNLKLVEQQFLELVRLAASIKEGTVTASLILRKLGSHPRQNSFALALRELGRIERTLFTLHWLQDPALRRRVQVGLNKGKARKALARAVFFYRLGEIRDPSFENQRYRVSGLNLVVTAISLWNTVYLERAILALRQRRPGVDALLKHLSPLGWETYNLTGDYVWHANKRVGAGRFQLVARADDVLATEFRALRAETRRQDLTWLGRVWGDDRCRNQAQVWVGMRRMRTDRSAKR